MAAASWAAWEAEAAAWEAEAAAWAAVEVEDELAAVVEFAASVAFHAAETVELLVAEVEFAAEAPADDTAAAISEAEASSTSRFWEKMQPAASLASSPG